MLCYKCKVEYDNGEKLFTLKSFVPYINESYILNVKLIYNENNRLLYWEKTAAWLLIMVTYFLGGRGENMCSLI